MGMIYINTVCPIVLYIEINACWWRMFNELFVRTMTPWLHDRILRAKTSLKNNNKTILDKQIDVGQYGHLFFALGCGYLVSWSNNDCMLTHHLVYGDIKFDVIIHSIEHFALACDMIFCLSLTWHWDVIWHWSVIWYWDLLWQWSVIWHWGVI